MKYTNFVCDMWMRKCAHVLFTVTVYVELKQNGGWQPLGNTRQLCIYMYVKMRRSFRLDG